MIWDVKISLLPRLAALLYDNEVAVHVARPSKAECDALVKGIASKSSTLDAKAVAKAKWDLTEAFTNMMSKQQTAMAYSLASSSLPGARICWLTIYP